MPKAACDAVGLAPASASPTLPLHARPPPAPSSLDTHPHKPTHTHSTGHTHPPGSWWPWGWHECRPPGVAAAPQVAPTWHPRPRPPPCRRRRQPCRPPPWWPWPVACQLRAGSGGARLARGQALHRLLHACLPQQCADPSRAHRHGGQARAPPCGPADRPCEWLQCTGPGRRTLNPQHPTQHTASSANRTR